jgi:hypothetical protein
VTPTEIRRAKRRCALLNAINGDHVTVLEYVSYRAQARPLRHLVLFGVAIYDEARLARLAAHWFARLLKLQKKARMG